MPRTIQAKDTFDPEPRGSITESEGPPAMDTSHPAPDATPPGVAFGAFDRLSAITALLDGTGRIVATNEAWRLFAHLNGGSSIGVGTDYVAECDRAARRGDADAAQAAALIRRVLEGGPGGEALEYPCPSPVEDRWYRLEVRPASATGAPGEPGAIVSHVDITSQRVSPFLDADAEHDDLTGLLDRRGLVLLLEVALASRRDRERSVRLLHVDVDGLARVNERFGWRVGDEVLAAIARRLRRAARETDAIARVGDDEFALLCRDLDDAGADALAHRLRGILARPYQVGASEVVVTVSVGVAAGRDRSAGELLDAAEADMFVDKGRPRSGHPGPRSPADAQAAFLPLGRPPTEADAAEDAPGPVVVRRHPRPDLEVSRDALTGLLTRPSLVAWIDEVPPDGPAGSSGQALVLIDVGSLDTLNDAYGHEVGDQVVLRCSHDLQVGVHCGDVVARLSDHTFAVWCGHSASARHCVAHAERLRAHLARPRRVAGIDVRLRVVAAAAERGSGRIGGAELLRRADTALTRARRDGSTRIYDRSMRDELLRQVEVQGLVDQAIASGRVDLGYQPLVRLDDQTTIGAEALLRMVDERDLPVAPTEVIEAAERSGRIAELGDLILRTACIDAARWNRSAPERTVPVSVNLSARQLDDGTLPRRVAAALTAAGLGPSGLCLEVTEGAIMADPVRSSAILVELKALGVRLSVDDFGTGYSSLAYLKDFPLDEVKIDRSFVAGLPTRAEDVAIVGAITAMAGALGLDVVAEGIETERNREGLLAAGASRGQGFLWSPALSASDLDSWLTVESDRSVGVSRPGDAPPPIAVRATGSVEERIDSVLQVLAHELRGPLTVIGGHASLLDAGSPTVVQESREAIDRAVRRMDGILTRIVQVATHGPSAALAAAEALDVRLLVEDTIAELPRTSAAHVRYLDRPAEPLVVDGDAVQLGQALRNLLTNAERHTPPGTPVEVRTEAFDGTVEITVADRGPGIDPPDLPLVFRKYGRSGTSNGTGLGLFLARRIARSHGGDVRYRRRSDGPGAVFCLHLPAQTDP